MPEPWLFVDALTEATIALRPDDRHHLRSVLRARDGARLTVSDGLGGTAPAVLDGDHVRIDGPVRREAAPRPAIAVCQALPKGRKFDEVVRVLTELGVSSITSIAGERSVARLDEVKAERARERWRGVARAAAEQSRRPWLPRIAGPSPLADVLEGGATGVIAQVGAVTALSRALPAAVDGADVVTIAIGPEGGWTDAEAAVARAAGLHAVHLGATVLRTEHAATVAVAVASAAIGRF